MKNCHTEFKFPGHAAAAVAHQMPVLPALQDEVPSGLSQPEYTMPCCIHHICQNKFLIFLSPNWTSEHQHTFSKPTFLVLIVPQDQAQINISKKHSSSSTTLFLSNYLNALHQMHISSTVQMHCLLSPDFRKGQRS